MISASNKMYCLQNQTIHIYTNKVFEIMLETGDNPKKIIESIQDILSQLRIPAFRILI